MGELIAQSPAGQRLRPGWVGAPGPRGVSAQLKRWPASGGARRPLPYSDEGTGSQASNLSSAATRCGQTGDFHQPSVVLTMPPTSWSPLSDCDRWQEGNWHGPCKVVCMTQRGSSRLARSSRNDRHLLQRSQCRHPVGSRLCDLPHVCKRGNWTPSDRVRVSVETRRVFRVSVQGARLLKRLRCRRQMLIDPCA